MRNLLNPKWLLVLNTLPIVVLLVLLAGEYAVIHTLLPKASQQVWQGIGTALLVLGAAQAGFALWQMHRKQRLTVAYGVVALSLHIAFLYAYGSFLRQLFPTEVPRWMVPGEMELYAGTFLMPTLAHAVLVLLVRLTPEEQSHRALPNFGVAVAIPAVAYLFGQLILPLWRVPAGEFGEHALIVLLIATTLGFLFFLARGVYILTSSRTGVWAKYQLVWKALIALVLPLIGLATNSGLILNFGSAENGVFGDFNGPWFYGLAVLNGVLVCCPSPRGKWGRLALFAGRAATLAYTLYFFLVFLPFLPLSLVAVVAVGLGFLMLTPLVLLLVHLRELSQDFEVLRSYFSRRVLVSILIGSGLLLPLGITGTYLHHRQVLHAALAYLYLPDYASAQTVEADALVPVLQEVRDHKRGGGGMFGSHLPYLSSYFNWLVLDNMTLSNQKLNRLSQVFMGEPPVAEAPGNPAADNPDQTRLTQITSRSTYNMHQATWTSWVELEMTNTTAADNAEYVTTLQLPAGCWVQDYYLDIRGRREKGILAEKKAATWVFSQIRNEQRDPGILYYLTGNRVALRVFPFAAREVRRTGFQLVHKEPVVLHLADRAISLGDSAKSSVTTPVTLPGGQVTYLSAAAKRALPLVRRRPYYHFLLDASASVVARRPAYARQVAAFLKQRPGTAAMARYSLVSATTKRTTESEWQAALAAEPATGGFYLEGAMRQLLAETQTNPAATYPVFVAVTDDFARALLPADFAELQDATPEQSVFYVLTPNAPPVAHSLRQDSSWPLAAAPSDSVPAVRAWPSAGAPRAYLPNDEQPSVVLVATELQLPATVGQGWKAGLWLQGYQTYAALHPAAAETMRLSAIKASFRSGIMTPLTSYLALENEAQKAALRRKQKEVLNAHAALDAGEDTQRMSEPEVWLLLLLAGGWGLVQWYRRRKLQVF
ncbi:MSEP-CTERM sorting domain-containing protein [Hymenobacter norwichensis]|uniref:MSEP-CTERM sorting domain-containing protein n=1 Tax=Hymenobacter norwichensis TaxID=223903 RepID=UPI0003B6487A|nr:MSEP-CTERM sorting domain-containing protein [Hymenobacter norwichensis]